MTQAQADALYQAAYQAYVDTAGTAALRDPDPRMAFTNLISTSAPTLRTTLARPLDSALVGVLNLRLRL